MANPKSLALGMWFVAGLFAGVGIYGAVKGRHIATYIAIALVFAIIGAAVKRQSSEPTPRSPSEES